MKKLDIAITKAQLNGFTVTLEKDGTPSVTAVINLLTEGGKKITNYSASTYAYDEGKKLKVPPKAYELLGQAGRLIEASIVQHCRDSQGALGDGSTNSVSEVPF